MRAPNPVPTVAAVPTRALDNVATGATVTTERRLVVTAAFMSAVFICSFCFHVFLQQWINDDGAYVKTKRHPCHVRHSLPLPLPVPTLRLRLP